MPFLMKILGLTLTVVGLLITVPASAFRDIVPPEDVAASIDKRCVKLSVEDRDRCLMREKKRWVESQRLLRTPTKDFEFRDAQDFGQGHLREDLRAERHIAFRKEAQKRITYRQMKPVDDLNTERREYLNTLRMGRLECQLKDPGRSRSICMDQLGNWVRTQMQKTRGSMKVPSKL